MSYDEENHAVTSTSNDEEIGSSNGRLKQFLLCIVSTFLFILWAYSAYVQVNDERSRVMWFIFYLFHALTAAVFVVAKGFCGSDGLLIIRPLSLVAMALVIWSFALIIASAIEVVNSPKGDENQGGDAPQFNDREEKVLKLAGAALCFASALYHIALLKFCM
jgi:hypothetical protein